MIGAASGLSTPALSWPTLAVAGTGFLLGCRHGLDWDHISAITDLSASARDAAGPRRLGPALWYCIGHGLVIALLGAAVGILGLHLPGTIDRVFESIVGATLIALGTWVLYQLGRQRSGYSYVGRVTLLLGAARRLRRRGGPVTAAGGQVGGRTAFAVGVLHGSGAETPTQVVLFASAGASGSRLAAVVILLAFVTGLLLSDLGIAAVWLTGLVKSRRMPKVQFGLGALTAFSSLGVGALFLLGRAAVLPALFGG